MKWQVVIPCVGPDWLLSNCLESMNQPTTPVLVIDNTPDRSLTIPAWAETYRCGKNIGVAASWNLGLRKGADYTFLLSASMRFKNGLDPFIKMIEQDVSAYGARLGSHAWHAMVIGRKTVELVGYFDEDFYPAEYEDTDYTRRMALVGLPLKSLPELTPAGLTCVGYSIAGKLGLVEKSDIPHEHYLAKWGGEPNEEKFTTPFNGRV